METLLEKNKKIIFCAVTVLLIILSAYYITKIYSELRKDSMLGESTTPTTISFSGHGEVSASPDIANINFTISKDANTVKDAQTGVATIEKKALDLLRSKGIADTDIKTTDASFYPKYEYRQTACPAVAPTIINGSGVISSPTTYCNPSKQVLVGYTASESITVKVRNTDSVGDIMQGLGTTGVSNLNGPDFTIDNPNTLQAEARTKAIEDAQSKAIELAKELGVHLGKISDFSEGGTSPIMYATKNTAMSLGATPSAAPAVIPQGQTTITSDVTITYEIK